MNHRLDRGGRRQKGASHACMHHARTRASTVGARRDVWAVPFTTYCLGADTLQHHPGCLRPFSFSLALSVVWRKKSGEGRHINRYGQAQPMAAPTFPPPPPPSILETPLSTRTPWRKRRLPAKTRTRMHTSAMPAVLAPPTVCASLTSSLPSLSSSARLTPVLSESSPSWSAFRTSPSARGPSTRQIHFSTASSVGAGSRPSWKNRVMRAKVGRDGGLCLMLAWVI